MDKVEEAKLAVLRKLSFDGFRSSLTWMSHAQELYSSANVLWKKSSRLGRIESNPLARRITTLLGLRLDRYQRVAYLLVGLAIENLAKGLVIGRAAPDQQENILAELSKNHDIRTVLAKLPQEIRPEYSGKLVESLETHIVWASKYPIPKTVNGYKPQLSAADFSQIEKLYLDCTARFEKGPLFSV